ncbi:hypothetical protein [Haladaptatus sp. CMAA 1911]|uniref:hypothetical protein n=1 Tax=unclassified Haladaptatus TaxID=2622732 RepID=UPI00375458B0
MRDETPERGVEILRRGREPSEGSDHEVVEISVPVVNPRSTTRDSFVNGDEIVGRVPITDANVPDADEPPNATVITILEERVVTYYPTEDCLFTLTWFAGTDDWEYDEHDRPADGFDPETSTIDAEEAVIWERE